MKDKFKLGYDSLAESFKGYTANVIQTAGFILLALGWFLTSEKSRSFLESNRKVRRMVLCVIATICLIHVIVSWGYHVLVEKKFVLLEGLRYVETTFFDSYRVSVALFLVNAVLNVTLFALLFLVVLQLGRHAHKSISQQDS